MDFIYLSVFEFKRTFFLEKIKNSYCAIALTLTSYTQQITPLLRWWKSLPKVQVDEAECERVGTPKG